MAEVRTAFELIDRHEALGRTAMSRRIIRNVACRPTGSASLLHGPEPRDPSRMDVALRLRVFLDLADRFGDRFEAAARGQYFCEGAF
jgi:hypothetical protein